MTTLETAPPRPNASRLKWAMLAGFVILTMAIILLAVFRLPPFSSRGVTIHLDTSGMQYSETEIHARAGQPVTLELFNVDGYEHAFDIDELDIHVKLPGGATSTVNFTPSEAGVYPYYCGVVGHKEGGMVGSLIVEP